LAAASAPLAPLSLARASSALSASARRRSAQLIFLDVFHVSGQLTDRQGDLVQLLLNGTSSESAIDVDFYLLA